VLHGPVEIKALAEDVGFPRVSLYLPTHRKGRETRQDPIRLKNLLRDAAGMLEAEGLSVQEIDALFADVRAQLDDEVFWRYQDHGLAVFVAPDVTRYMRAPLSFEPQARVGRRFHVKPLLPSLMRDGKFFVLAASRDEVSLFEASRFGLTRLRDDRLPESAAPFVESTQFDNAVGFHAASRGSRSVQFHAAGESPQDEMQEQVEQFAIKVGKAVDAILASETAPLVVAADDRLLGMLRRHISYRETVSEGLREHPASIDEETLHARAYDLVRPKLDTGRREVVLRWEARKASGDASAGDRIEEIVAAAAAGRVEALVVDAEASVPGVFDPANGRAYRSPAGKPEGADDLVDMAVFRTLAQGGAVFSRPADRPDLPPVLAIFRF